ncbi:amino acid/amide ABC transporter ATP-binding protein 1, HAAT family [Albimonas donghaensis]|uniref:Amino acid/amide ABC transporter ATP-binding protein 1, HAAT family n=1 Tax=Albimonas donghaensis TaxID=356660 RepID=A0A1H2VJS9_9RHOB|nr:ABC transporter ATP-binding protein [Albimonas donghaensis]SDW68557.1 amino acid/amide ABC transporter ATP-binding protein 1, HAAT family [Albimonas donghaensis]
MTVAASGPLLETEGLTRRFGGLTAVDHVDFQLFPGEIRALIGPNGAGKTTFVGLLSGRIPPSEGRVRFGGEDVTRLPAHARMARGMAYTFQITSVFANLSLFDNVALAVQRRLARGEGLEAETMAALDRVGLAGRARQTAGDLSYGHQRLLEIAMGLAQRPRLLILDEPTQGLSDGEIEGFKALVRDVAAEATVLLIEHNMDVVMSLATRITVLDMGARLAEGDPAAIHADAAVQRAYLGG